MTADTKLRMPEPVGLQWNWLDSRARYKVLRVGRRGGKTRFAFSAAILGHGPGWEEQKPKYGGVLSGGDVVWICPTYSNLSMVLWREEIEPRMSHLPYVSLNKTLHDVEIKGLGALMLRSGDRSAIDSIRGVGKRLKGVIVDEAAHLDLRGALQDVILPALLDNDGWLILMSTTNAAGDGGYDDTGAPQIPSYFNQINKQIQMRERSEDWAEFSGTAYDNTTLEKAAIDALIAEYPPDSPKLRQEVFAELLESGVGLALPGLTQARHMCPAFTPDRHWNHFAAFDWGYYHNWSFGSYCVDEDGAVFKRDTLTGRLDLPEALDAKVRAAGINPKNLMVFAGPDVWRTRVSEKGKIQGQFMGPTVAEQLQLLGWKLVPAADARVAGLNNLRQYTYIDPAVQPEPKSRFMFMDTPGNKACLAQMARMQLDPKNPEDALKVDADASGRGGDDMYDECIPAHTLVMTERGPQAIADLSGTTGKVLTPIGWLGYNAVRLTQKAAEVWRITTVSGHSMEATANHEVLTTIGWRSLGSLGEGASVSGSVLLADLRRLLSSQNALAASGSMGGASWPDSRRDADSPSGRESGEQSGQQFGDRDVESARSTPQGNWRSLNPKKRSRSTDSPDDQDLAQERGRARLAWQEDKPDVEVSERPRLDLSAMWRRISDQDTESADQILSSQLQGESLTGTTEEIARVDYIGVMPVYNMEVETAHCYTLASGFIVHNCRYGLMSRPILAKAPVIEPPSERSLGYNYELGKPHERESGDQWLERQISGGRRSVLAGRSRIHRRRAQ